MWAAKVSNTMKEEDERNKELVSVFDENVDMESFSGEGAQLDITQSDSTMRRMTELGSLNELMETLKKLAFAFEKQESDMTAWKKMINEDIKSLKLDLKNSLGIQKDTVKSYLCMKKDVAEVKGQLEMVYGKKFFHQRN